MGRSYYVEESVEHYFSKLILQQKCYVTGLLIGQCSSQRDYLLLAAQTPTKVHECEATKKKGALSKLDEIDDEWVSMHAGQVCRMLPGGLIVIGVFLITSPELSKDSQNALRKLLFAAEKAAMKKRLWSLEENDVSDRVAVHMCSATRKIICRTFDVKDPKSTAKPADWKYQSSPLSWVTVDCNVCVDLTIPLSSSSSYQEQQKCTRTGLAKWAKEMDQVLVLFNGQLKDKDGDLFEEQKKTTRSAGYPSSQVLTANIVTPSSLNTDDRSTAVVQVCKSSLTLQGVVKCRGYIQSNKPKVREAVQALKRDMLSTVSDRCEILFEDILLNGPHTESENESCALPQRVFVPVTGSNIKLCDYVFGDETSEDLHNRFLEMLDQDLQTEGLEFVEENSSWTKTEKKQDKDISDHLDNRNRDQPDTLKRNTLCTKIHQNMGVVIASVVALVAAVLSFYYLSG